MCINEIVKIPCQPEPFPYMKKIEDAFMEKYESKFMNWFMGHFKDFCVSFLVDSVEMKATHSDWDTEMLVLQKSVVIRVDLKWSKIAVYKGRKDSIKSKCYIDFQFEFLSEYELGLKKIISHPVQHDLVMIEGIRTTWDIVTGPPIPVFYQQIVDEENRTFEIPEL